MDAQLGMSSCAQLGVEPLQRSRVDAVHALLSDSRLTLTDVAFCTGFSEQAHFSRTFRRYNDVPPSALRDLMRLAPRAARAVDAGG
ncbi:helix-turn-helix domain-containing protein [Myxococcus stipitatus]|uniref:helix-turn-helix domain-containing protein n=1 Tax=Myxococcus stipitatus TaxID=83455 RepID=UPI0030CF844A